MLHITFHVNMLNLCSFMEHDYGNQVLAIQSVALITLYTIHVRLYLFLTGLLLLMITAPIQEFSKWFCKESVHKAISHKIVNADSTYVQNPPCVVLY